MITEQQIALHHPLIREFVDNTPGYRPERQRIRSVLEDIEAAVDGAVDVLTSSNLSSDDEEFRNKQLAIASRSVFALEVAIHSLWPSFDPRNALRPGPTSDQLRCKGCTYCLILIVTSPKITSLQWRCQACGQKNEWSENVPPV